jgi:hypothetical protein
LSRAARPPARKAWIALDLPKVESVPKSVLRDTHFSVYVRLTERQETDYATIVGLIGAGGDLSRYYRASTNTDVLLREHQVMHLHLGGPGSDALLYLIQYPAYVLLLCVDTHRHMRPPPGGGLNMLGRKEFEVKVEAKIKVDIAKLMESVAKLVRKPKPPEPEGQGG